MLHLDKTGAVKLLIKSNELGSLTILQECNSLRKIEKNKDYQS